MNNPFTITITTTKGVRDSTRTPTPDDEKKKTTLIERMRRQSPSPLLVPLAKAQDHDFEFLGINDDLPLSSPFSRTRTRVLSPGSPYLSYPVLSCLILPYPILRDRNLYYFILLFYSIVLLVLFYSGGLSPTFPEPTGLEAEAEELNK